MTTLDARAANTASFTVNAQNETQAPLYFFLYQQISSAPAGASPLAWLVSQGAIGSQMQTRFMWDMSYSLYWAESGQLTPGIIVNVSQDVTVDPARANTSEFQFNGGIPSLTQPTQQSPSGALNISSAGNAPTNQFAVGYALSGRPAYAVNVLPNMRASFSTPAQCWIATSQSMRQGTVLDPRSLQNSARLNFPAGVNTLNAVLQIDGSWTITPG